MRYLKEIKTALKEFEINKKSYLLDIAERHQPNEIKYDTELIRKLECLDAQIYTLRWILMPKKKQK